MKDFEILKNNNFKVIGHFIINKIHKDGRKFVPVIDLVLSYENLLNDLIKLGKSLIF